MRVEDVDQYKLSGSPAKGTLLQDKPSQPCLWHSAPSSMVPTEDTLFKNRSHVYSRL